MCSSIREIRGRIFKETFKHFFERKLGRQSYWECDWRRGLPLQTYFYPSDGLHFQLDDVRKIPAYRKRDNEHFYFASYQQIAIAILNIYNARLHLFESSRSIKSYSSFHRSILLWRSFYVCSLLHHYDRKTECSEIESPCFFVISFQLTQFLWMSFILAFNIRWLKLTIFTLLMHICKN